MNISINCPSCGKPFHIPESLNGHRVGCPHCRQAIATPPPILPAPPQTLAAQAAPAPVTFTLANSSPQIAGSPARRDGEGLLNRMLLIGCVIFGTTTVILSACVIYLVLPSRNQLTTAREAVHQLPVDPASIPDNDPGSTKLSSSSVVTTNTTPSISVVGEAPPVAAAVPRSLEALHQLDDGPSDFSHAEWVAIKKKLYAEGKLGHEVIDGVYKYRGDPHKYLGVIRAMRSFR